MIDYLLAFESEDQAHAVLDPLGYGYPEQTFTEGEDEYTQPASWDGSRVLPTRVQVGEGEPVTVDDGMGGEFTYSPPIYAQGFWIAVSLPAANEQLWSIPATMHEADRNLANRGEPYALRTRFRREQLEAPWACSPIFAGMEYLGGGKSAEEQLTPAALEMMEASEAQQ